MRRVVLILAALAVVSLAASTAFAGGRHPGYPGGRGPYNYPGGFGYYAPYGYYAPSGFGYYSGAWNYGYDPDPLSFAAAARRIQAKYSPYRSSTHPRSLYQGPPYPYGYWGW
jgi:hypothetical protein